MVGVPASFTRSTRKRSPGESVMPGFPFGPIRPNTRADLPFTARVRVPAVRRSLAEQISGAAVAGVIGRKGIALAMATPDARICRRVRSVGFSFSLMDLSMSVPARKLATNSVWCWSGIAAFCVLLPDISDGGAEMAGDLETDFELVAQRSPCANTRRSLPGTFTNDPRSPEKGLPRGL